MLNAELYEKLEAEFAKNRIGEEVEDILLEMAEIIADGEVTGKEQTIKRQIGKGVIRVTGILEEDGGVLIRTMSINGTEYVIEDYML